MVESTCSTSALFLSRKWPSEASNHEKNRCAALMKATPYRARGKLLLTWRAARRAQNIVFPPKTRSKMRFSQFYAGFHPPLCFSCQGASHGTRTAHSIPSAHHATTQRMPGACVARRFPPVRGTAVPLEAAPEGCPSGGAASLARWCRGAARRRRATGRRGHAYRSAETHGVIVSATRETRITILGIPTCVRFFSSPAAGYGSACGGLPTPHGSTYGTAPSGRAGGNLTDWLDGMLDGGLFVGCGRCLWKI